jgi:3-deoxy-D-manno-octulosonic-acid transferase
MYQIGFFIYITIFRLVAIFHKKARKMVKGHHDTWRILREGIDKNKPWLWFHASSLGEFEQGRPIMERIRAQHPEYGILLTFYSPSGYEVRKNYTVADVVCYLPFDTVSHVRRFLNVVRPQKAFFIKYEFWPNYLTLLKNRRIPTYLISGIFRPNQLFFKNYAPFYRRMLNSFTHIFVQNQASLDLLKSIGYEENVSISGDTRFDRVLEIRQNAKELDIIQSFSDKRKASQKMLVAGSSWPKDEAFFIPYFNAHPNIKLIIAPHQIHEDHLLSIEAQLSRPSQRYSKTNPENVSSFDCLIIDCFGILSSIYRYGDIAYIGGGFGAGIHNTLEAAVYGIPVLFGPNYKKFHEANRLVACGGGIEITSKESVESVLEDLLNNEKARLKTGNLSGEMVQKGSGGTNCVLRTIPF